MRILKGVGIFLVRIEPDCTEADFFRLAGALVRFGRPAFALEEGEYVPEALEEGLVPLPSDDRRSPAPAGCRWYEYSAEKKGFNLVTLVALMNLAIEKLGIVLRSGDRDGRVPMDEEARRLFRFYRDSEGKEYARVRLLEMMTVREIITVVNQFAARVTLRDEELEYLTRAKLARHLIPLHAWVTADPEEEVKH